MFFVYFPVSILARGSPQATTRAHAGARATLTCSVPISRSSISLLCCCQNSSTICFIIAWWATVSMICIAGAGKHRIRRGQVGFSKQNGGGRRKAPSIGGLGFTKIKWCVCLSSPSVTSPSPSSKPSSSKPSSPPPPPPPPPPPNPWCIGVAATAALRWCSSCAARC